MTTTDTTAETRNCLRCGRELRSVAALARGYGEGCWRKVRAAERTADLSAWTPAQIAEAEQAIEDGAVVPSTREGVYHVVSVDGSEVHLVHRDGCSCTAGLKTHHPRPCWHRCAVAIITVSTVPAEPAPAAVKPSPIALPGDTAPVAADVLSALADELSAGGDILPALTGVWAALEAVGALDPIPAF